MIPLLISVVSLIVFVYKSMEQNALRFIIAPATGLIFGYIIYLFALGIPIYILLPILAVPVISMILILVSP